MGPIPRKIQRNEEGCCLIHELDSHGTLVYHGLMSCLDRLYAYFGCVIPDEHLDFCIRMSEYTDTYVRTAFSVPSLHPSHEGHPWLALDPQTPASDASSLSWVLRQWSIDPIRFNTPSGLPGALEQSKCLSSTLMNVRTLPWVANHEVLRSDLIHLRDAIQIDCGPDTFWSALHIAQMATQDTIDVLLKNPVCAAPIGEFNPNIFISYPLFQTRRPLIYHWSPAQLKVVCNTLEINWPGLSFGHRSLSFSPPIETLPLNVFALEIYFDKDRRFSPEFAQELQPALKKGYLERWNVADDVEMIFTYCHIKNIFERYQWNWDGPMPSIIESNYPLVETFHDHWLDQARQYHWLMAYE